MKYGQIGFIYPFSMTFLANCIGTYIHYSFSSDQGLWSIQLLVGGLLSLIYSGFFYTLYQKKPISLISSLLINLTVSGILLLSYYLFYIHTIDWLAVNNGYKTLTLVESYIHSAWSIFFPYGVGLISTWILGIYSNKKIP